MKMNLVNKVCSIIALTSMLSAPMSVAFAEGSGPTAGGDHGTPSAGGNHGGNTPSPSKPAPTQPAPPAQPDPARPVANNPPQQGPRPDGGDNNNNNGTANDIGAGIAGGIILVDVLSSLFGNKAVSWNWGEATDANGNNTLVCYGFNKKGQQTGTKPADDSKCAQIPQPVYGQYQQNSDGSESCYEYYSANNDLLNAGQPMDDNTLCDAEPAAANQ